MYVFGSVFDYAWFGQGPHPLAPRETLPEPGGQVKEPRPGDALGCSRIWGTPR